MIRSILIAALSGILAGALTAYILSAPGGQAQVTAREAAGSTVSQAPAPAEAWPICSSMASLAESADWAALDPEFAAGKRALAASDWHGAIKALASAGLRDDRNADIQNYLGDAYRHLRQLDPAVRHYQRALILNPRHRSAHEHLGEAYLVQGNLAKAREHLAALGRICLIPCEEFDNLKRAIAVYNKHARS